LNEVLLPPRPERWPRKAFFKRMLWSAAGACALGGLYAWRFEDHWMRTERHDMPLPSLGEDLCGATIAHISDLHCSPLVLERYLRRCVKLLNSLEVDFVAITGDFITGPKHYARNVARVLRALEPRIATVACLGNHDYGVIHPTGFGAARGLSRYVSDRLTHADMFVMLNESRTFRVGDAAIQFVGVEDYWTPYFDPARAFEMIDPDLPTIALCHNPDPAPLLSRHGADWVLSGHTHGVQRRDTRFGELIYPADNRQFSAGRYQLHNGTSLYVNRGIGYARRISLNARPEVALFTLSEA